MKKFIYNLYVSNIFFILSLLSYFFWSICAVNNNYLPLPASIHDRAVYYKKSEQLSNWSCGYNALFRACELEGNSYRNLNAFNTICLPYVKAQGKLPTDSAWIYQLEELAKKLGLQKFQGLITDEYATIVPAFSGEFMYNPYWESQKEALERIQQKIITKLREFLAQRKQMITYVHFICHVWANNEDHGILISLVQNSYGKRSLYIFDNLNGIINDSCQIKRYINYLIDIFKIDTLPMQAKVLTTSQNIKYVTKLSKSYAQARTIEQKK